jgi:hypothetical protein
MAQPSIFRGGYESFKENEKKFKKNKKNRKNYFLVFRVWASGCVVLRISSHFEGRWDLGVTS